MSEIQKNDISIDEFIEILKTKDIPFIDISRAREVLEILSKYPHPACLFSRLIDSFDYINKEEFINDIKDFNKLILENIPTSFNLVQEEKGSSNEWIYSLLPGKNSLVPVTTITTSEDKDIDRLESGEVTGNFVVIDDWSISGVQIRDDILKRLKRFKGNTDNCTVFLMYASNFALAEIKKDFPEVNIIVLRQGRIKTLGEILTPEDIEFLKVFESLDTDIPINEEDTLNVGWWCIPDNIPSMFKFKTGNMLGLYNSELLVKPYIKY